MKNLFKTLICLATLVSGSASCFATNTDDSYENSEKFFPVGASLGVCPADGTISIQSTDRKLEAEYFVKDFATEEELINELTEKYISYSQSDIENNFISKDWIKLTVRDFFYDPSSNLSGFFGR